MPSVVSKNDIDFITEVMNSRQGEGLFGYLDKATGKVLIDSVNDPIGCFSDGSKEELDGLDLEQDDRYIPIPKEGSYDSYQDMVDFIATVKDDHLVDLLAVAIQGKGAFRQFKDVLRQAEDGSELERWYRFSNQREYDRAIAWLAEVGFCVEE
jgi:hypothetical protein